MQFFTEVADFFKSGALSCFGDAETGRRVMIVFALLSLLHLLTVYMPGIVSRISAYLNIAAHIAAFVYFMWLKLTIYQAVLVFMASVFVYTFFNFIPYLIYKALEKREKGGEDK